MIRPCQSSDGTLEGNKQDTNRLCRSLVTYLILLTFLLTTFALYDGTHTSYLRPMQSILQSVLNSEHYSLPPIDRSIHCSELGLVRQRDSLENQQYHDFPLSEMCNSSCQSRYQQQCFWKNDGSKFYPETTFLAALRAYEVYHARCTNRYNLTDLAISGSVPPNCSYLVWKPMDVMGNQLLSLVSSFAYSLLTNRVMLINTESHIHRYLCNPFPLSSWAVPHNFPAESLHNHAKRLFVHIDEIKRKQINMSEAPNRLSVIIVCCDKGRDHQFFCPTTQRLLHQVNWLFYKSHEYTLAGFYLIPEFRDNLKIWFPNNDVFMHVARYLLSPQNQVWEQIKDLYKAHMEGKHKQVGIQARAWHGQYSPNVNAHILRCANEQGLLPKVQRPGMHEDSRVQNISVLVASLRPEYRHNLELVYSGSSVSVFSASSESSQRTGDMKHDIKAIIDIWLLSFVHQLVITPASTFGTAASGIGGLVPFVFVSYGANNSQRACEISNLSGPCFIVHPKNQACELDSPPSSISDPASMVPELKYCNHNIGIGVQNI